MQFKLVLCGVVLLAAGLIAYSSIPNVHRTLILQTVPLPSVEPIQIPAGGLVEISHNLSFVSGRQNNLLINLTVISSPGDRGVILFRVFQKNQIVSCQDTKQQSYVVNQDVANQSLRAPVVSPGPYCFAFDNYGSRGAKTVLMATSISSSFEQVSVANDGEMNLMGLGTGALGFLVVIAGFFRKTVIPWE